MVQLVLSKDPVLRYQVDTKTLKTSQGFLSTGGTEYPVNPVVDALSERIFFIKALRQGDTKRRKRIKDRNPDQMKGFKQVSFNLIFRYSVMNIIRYFNLNVGLK